MTTTLFDPREIMRRCVALTKRAETLHPLATVSVHLWSGDFEPWCASASFVDLDAVGCDPGEALDAIAVMIERRIRHDAKLAETLGVEAA